MRTRYYSPDLKRFMNCDILTGSIANPSTLNLYAYVNGDPISYVDPFGLCREESNVDNSSNDVTFEFVFDPNVSDYIGWGAVFALAHILLQTIGHIFDFVVKNHQKIFLTY